MTGLRRFVDEAPARQAPALARLVPRAKPARACELCAAAVPSEHRHLVDLHRRALACACRACALLFDDAGAADGRYRAVPERYLRVTPFALTPLQWNALQIPVGLAFFMRTAERTVAFYPSPAGATESELVLDAWAEVVAANPALADLAADTEAALVRFRVAEPECYIVPIDRCYELVGAVRTSWRGFDGGPEVAGRIADFFADVRARSRPVGAA
jgi:hypothetical protein